MSGGTITDRHELHGIQPVLLVPDVQATVDYYVQRLGFHLDFLHGDPPVHARVHSGVSINAVRLRFELSEGTLPSQQGFYLFVHVGTDIDGLFHSIKERGVDIVREPADVPWAARVFRIRDLNGHVLDFVQPHED